MRQKAATSTLNESPLARPMARPTLAEIVVIELNEGVREFTNMIAFPDV